MENSLKTVWAHGPGVTAPPNPESRRRRWVIGPSRCPPTWGRHLAGLQAVQPDPRECLSGHLRQPEAGVHPSGQCWRDRARLRES